MANHICLVCKDVRVRLIPEFSTLSRVTSDCKPWPAGGQLGVCETCGTIQKIPDKLWFEEIKRIYSAYEIYHLSDGAEQLIFSDDGSTVSRSQALVEFIVRHACQNIENGQAIDIGCGNGSALANFSKALPNWSFDGSELSNKTEKNLQRIPGFRKLHTGSIADITQQYELVSMIHSLEHMPDPANILKSIYKLLRPQGMLFIEVPDIETSPFDLLVADHLTHFSQSTLKMLALQIGFCIESLTNMVLPKEITFLGKRGTETHFSSDPKAGIQIAERAISWLKDVRVSGVNAAKASNFGLFGSSISSIWMYGALRDRVKFFVDEDISRIGNHFDGKPVLSPAQIPKDGTVFIPFVRSTAEKLAHRLANLRVNFVLPPQ